MNIIPLDQQPKACPACGRNAGNAKACGGNCVRVNVDRFNNVTSYGDSIVPHVHLTCSECGFTFLVACSNPDEVARVL